MFDAHRDDPEFGYRFLVDEADAGEQMAGRTAWRICSTNHWWSAFGKPRRGKNGRPGPPVHDDPGATRLHRWKSKQIVAQRYHRTPDR